MAHWFKIEAHEVKKGKTFLSTIKDAGFPTTAAGAIFKSSYNEHLRKKNKYKSYKEVKAGDTIYLPNFTKKQLDWVWDVANDISWNVGDALKTEELHLKIGRIEEKIESLEAEVAELLDSYRYPDEPLQKAANKCREKIDGGGAQLGAIAACQVTIEKWQRKQRELDKTTSAKVTTLQKTLMDTRKHLQSLRGMQKITGGLAGFVVKIAEKVKDEATKGAKNSF